ncbi:unnamed protein product [Dibothriocephalus latus]|uniref:Transglutaminase-like domain-containing protein n=1 Tax=Dibothriocephalus latus TaxID=60516 RepID=A0A3P7N2Z9_DIBLA|nr:unnamed protein product [Dibothriocephalus latus]
MRFTGSNLQHCWNAIRIDGTWPLVDCQWGARSDAATGADKGKVTYELETFWFLTDPGQFINSQFPHDADWQLLHNPITLEVSTWPSLCSS